jgi:hypothetical protein
MRRGVELPEEPFVWPFMMEFIVNIEDRSVEKGHTLTYASTLSHAKQRAKRKRIFALKKGKFVRKWTSSLDHTGQSPGIISTNNSFRN